MYGPKENSEINSQWRSLQPMTGCAEIHCSINCCACGTGSFFSADKGIAKYSHGLEIIVQLKKRSASGNVSKVPGALSKLTDDLKAFIKTNIP